MVNIIKYTLTFFQAEEILHSTKEILRHHDTHFGINIKLELLVDFVASYTGQIITLLVKEKTLQQGLRVGNGWWITRAKLTVDVLQCGLFVVSRVFLQRLQKNFIFTGINNVDGLVTKLDELVHITNRHRLVGLHNDDFIVKNVFESYFLSELFFVVFFNDLLQVELLDVVKVLTEITIRRPAHGAQKGGSEELTTATASIEVDVKQVVGVKLGFQP